MCAVQLMQKRIYASKDNTERARLHIQRAFLYADNAAETKRALRDVREGLRLAPYNNNVFVCSAKVLEKVGLYEKASRVLEAAARLKPVPCGAPTDDTTSSRALLQMPAELMVLIFSYLPFSSMLSCMGVCKHWYAYIVQCASLWHSIHIRSQPATSSVLKDTIVRQARSLSTYIERGKSCVQSLSLSPPISNHDKVRSMLEGLGLSSLSVECDHSSCYMWYHWAFEHTKVHTLCIRAISRKEQTHPWLSRPLRSPMTTTRANQGTSLRNLKLINTPPLTADPATLHALERLETFVYDAGDSMHALQDVQAKCVVPTMALIRQAHTTLKHVEIQGAAVWTGVFGQVQSPVRSFPHLHVLHAPLTCMATPSTEWPALTSFECHLSRQRHDIQDLLKLIQAMKATLDTWTIRLTSDADARLAHIFLKLCRHLRAIHVIVDEHVPDMLPPVLDTMETAMQRPLTPSLLVSLLTPGVYETDVHCPNLRTLRIHNDTSLKGRELIHMVRTRTLLSRGYAMPDASLQDGSDQGSDVSRLTATSSFAPDRDAIPTCDALTHLHIDTCLGLQAEAIPILQKHVMQVSWSPNSVARAHLLARRYHEPRTLRARFL